MYQILFNGKPIYDPRDEDLRIGTPDCHLAVGSSGSLSFTIDDDHPYAHTLTKLTGVLELKASGRCIYRGRIRKDTRDFNLSRLIETEGLLACLNDSIIPPHSFPNDWLADPAYLEAAASGNVVRFYLGWILEEHNRQVGPDQQIHLGEVTVADPNNYISRESSEYTTAMETVRGKLEELLGGYLLPDYSGETTVLHYYADLPLTNTQTVEYGENLLDLVTETDAAETYTAILPVGAEGLTLADLPDGEISPGFFKEGLIIYSRTAEEQYNGLRVTRKVDWNDVTQAQNLQTKALTQLSTEGTMLAQTITVKAVDLGGDGDISRFVVGRYIQLQSSPHGFSATYPLMELDPDILDPGSTVITLGVTVKAASDLARSTKSSTKESMNQLQLEINKQQGSITELDITSQEMITAAIQTSESIVFTALERYVETSNYEAFQQAVQNEFQLLADALVLRFTEATEATRNVDGDLQVTRELLTKYFEFGQNGLTIKAGENTMTLSLDNDMIIFEKNGQQFGWWDGVDFHTGNIVIGVTERAQFGSFAFVPRDNGLSFLEVGE